MVILVVLLVVISIPVALSLELNYDNLGNDEDFENSFSFSESIGEMDSVNYTIEEGVSEWWDDDVAKMEVWVCGFLSDEPRLRIDTFGEEDEISRVFDYKRGKMQHEKTNGIVIEENIESKNNFVDESDESELIKGTIMFAVMGLVFREGEHEFDECQEKIEDLENYETHIDYHQVGNEFDNKVFHL